jgi:hypothetical protein
VKFLKQPLVLTHLPHRKIICQIILTNHTLESTEQHVDDNDVDLRKLLELFGLESGLLSLRSQFLLVLPSFMV